MQTKQALAFKANQADYVSVENKRKFIMFVVAAAICLLAAIIWLVVVLSVAQFRQVEILLPTLLLSVALLMIGARAAYLSWYAFRYPVLVALKDEVIFIREGRGYIKREIKEIGRLVLSIGDLFTETDFGGNFNIELDETTLMYEVDSRSYVVNIGDPKLLYGLIVTQAEKDKAKDKQGDEAL